ncbi:hypothetical protein FisN_28Lu115 [Fistulifera solaris]|jgi:hypothetical protein|uniref:HSF-type DNA-binding domain-containing protein n=1 Tax=Fistulifera solaris TaxID=1519565 RepID=A0A1Z5KSF4_FISSO|nr:hypothetical protein FisN_28Lu115 [Fistulifera solaris]|eukprot:GAX29243.1 hypothetical protein FisN_28Lu115 [Fistulifera solaris]
MNLDQGNQPLDSSNEQQKQSDAHAEDKATVNVDSQSRKDPFGGKKVEMTFPAKLMCILEDPDFQSCIYWSDEGDAFCVHPNLFTEKVLGPYFQGSKFHSFTRKLNRFQFKRLIGDARFPQDAFAFQHKLFVRGKPELMAGMKEGSRSASSDSASSKKRGILKNAQEPLTRVITGASNLQPSAAATSLDSSTGSGLGMPPINVSSTLAQEQQQHYTGHPLSALELLQQNQLQSLLQIQQHNTQHSAFPILTGSNLEAFLRPTNQSNADHAEYRPNLPPNQIGGQRPLLLPTDADILRLLSNNQPSGNLSTNDVSGSNDALLNYLQQQMNNRRN